MAGRVRSFAEVERRGKRVCSLAVAVIRGRQAYSNGISMSVRQEDKGKSQNLVAAWDEALLASVPSDEHVIAEDRPASPHSQPHRCQLHILSSICNQSRRSSLSKRSSGQHCLEITVRTVAHRCWRWCIELEPMSPARPGYAPLA